MRYRPIGTSAAFEDVAVYALPETIDFLKEHGEASREDHLKIMGDEAPGKVVIPRHTVRLDEKNRTSDEIIDGVRYLVLCPNESLTEFNREVSPCRSRNFPLHLCVLRF